MIKRILLLVLAISMFIILAWTYRYNQDYLPATVTPAIASTCDMNIVPNPACDAAQHSAVEQQGGIMIRDHIAIESVTSVILLGSVVGFVVLNLKRQSASSKHR